MKDILYKESDMIFSYRVGGILIRDGNILLQRPVDDDYAIIGGHVAAMETTEETLRREFREEIHADIQVNRLIAVGEIFFPWGNKPCHQISLFYDISLKNPDSLPKNGSFWGFDDHGNRRIDLKYAWVPLTALENGIKVYPQELIPHILSGSREILHFISNDLP